MLLCLPAITPPPEGPAGLQFRGARRYERSQRFLASNVLVRGGAWRTRKPPRSDLQSDRVVSGPGNHKLRLARYRLAGG